MRDIAATLPHDRMTESVSESLEAAAIYSATLTSRERCGLST